jgi:hypothetical protein
MSEAEVATAMAKAERDAAEDQGLGTFAKAAHMSQQEGRDWQGAPPRDPGTMGDPSKGGEGR